MLKLCWDQMNFSPHHSSRPFCVAKLCGTLRYQAYFCNCGLDPNIHTQLHIFYVQHLYRMLVRSVPATITQIIYVYKCFDTILDSVLTWRLPWQYRERQLQARETFSRGNKQWHDHIYSLKCIPCPIMTGNWLPHVPTDCLEQYERQIARAKRLIQFRLQSILTQWLQSS